MHTIGRRIVLAALASLLTLPGAAALHHETVEIEDAPSDGGPAGLGVERVDVAFADWEHTRFTIRTEAPVEALLPLNATHETRLSVRFAATVDGHNDTRSCYVYASPYRELNETRWRAAGTCDWDASPVHYAHPEVETTLPVDAQGRWINITVPLALAGGFVLGPDGDEFRNPIATVSLVDRNVADPFGDPPFDDEVWDRGPDETDGAAWKPWLFPPVGTVFNLTAEITEDIGCLVGGIQVPKGGTVDVPLRITNLSPYELSVGIMAEASRPEGQLAIEDTTARVASEDSARVMITIRAEDVTDEAVGIQVAAQADERREVVRFNANLMRSVDGEVQFAEARPAVGCGGCGDEMIGLPALSVGVLLVALALSIAGLARNRPNGPPPVRPPRPPAPP